MFSFFARLKNRASRQRIDATHKVADPTDRAPVYHWLVGPDEVDYKNYARLHGYDLYYCKHVRTEADILCSRPGTLKIHYLRGWNTLPQDLLARLRYIASKQA